MAPPPLPSIIPTEEATNKANGVKRAHSPGNLPPEKSRRQNDMSGFRNRAANQLPDIYRPGTARQLESSSPQHGYDRNLDYPNARRRSIDVFSTGAGSRDPSLERHQSYYRRDSFDRYEPRDPRLPSPRRPLSNGGRNNNARRAGGRQEPGYRASAALDLRKGGQSKPRPF